MPTSTVSDSSPSPPQSSLPHDIPTSTSSSQAPMGSRVMPSESSDAPDSFLTRFVLTPIRMISFLLSLALIDCRNRSLLTESSSIPICTPRSSSAWQKYYSLLGRTPSQYSDVDTTTQEAGGEHAGDQSRESKEKEGWTMKKKHPEMMKMEIRDAVGIRARVVVGLAVLSVVLGVGGVLATTMLWRMWSRRQGID